jgi:hypothetical protein
MGKPGADYIGVAVLEEGILLRQKWHPHAHPGPGWYPGNQVPGF